MAEPHRPPSPATLTLAEAAPRVLATPPGQVRLFGGIDAERLRRRLHERDAPGDGRLALFVELDQAASADSIVGEVVAGLAEAALRIWPVWYTDADLGLYGADTLGGQALRLVLRELSRLHPAISPTWAEAAVALASAGKPPRVAGIAPEIQLAQLCLAINCAGLVLVFSMAGTAPERAAPLVHALEWIARQSGAAVVALCPALPPNLPPFDRILFGAREIAPETAAADQAVVVQPAPLPVWLEPIVGRPHPLSEIEKTLAAVLRRDPELALLFAFNQSVETIRGSRPRVDLLWKDGGLVVELDGYSDHNTRAAFARDRHRDYELMLSGYAVLRIANDEVAQDVGRAVEKIRDLVRLRAAQALGRGENG